MMSDTREGWSLILMCACQVHSKYSTGCQSTGRKRERHSMLTDVEIYTPLFMKEKLSGHQNNVNNV